MIKRVGSVRVDVDKLIPVAEKNNVKILRSKRFNYIKLENNKYTLLIDEDLKKAAIEYNFKVQELEKNNKIIHASVTDSHYFKLEKFKTEHNINTSQAIKKLIESI